MFSMKSTTWMVKAILLLLLFNSCQPKPAQPLTYDPLPIVKLFMFDRDLYEPFREADWGRFEKWGSGWWCKDSFMLDGLGIKAYAFPKGGGVGGPQDKVLCFCWNKIEFQQVEFLYKGEHQMSKIHWSEHRQAGNTATLGQQLSQIARYYGPELSKNKDSLKVFLTAVMVQLLGCPLIKKEHLDDAVKNPDEKKYNFADFLITWGGIPQTNKKCIAQLKAIQVQMAKNDPDLLFFEGEYYNGIWQAKIKMGRDQHYQIKLDYLNGECAYTIWF
jgi:hypothetical protein